MADSRILFCGSSSEYLKEELTKDSNSSNGGVAFRIPSLVNANGTLIAAIDKAQTGADWGYIELAVRTSEDGGKTWSDIKTIASPPARQINSNIDNIKTSFFIDPCMAVAPNGDVIMIATFFPESKGFHDRGLLDKKKIAFAAFNGNNYPLIYDRDDNYYYVTENGVVLNSSKANSGYTVKDLGELYKGDEYVGNIFLNGAIGKSADENNKTTFGAPLKAPKRSYIYMLKSSDNGKTWSEPVDITPQIFNQEDGVFFAVCPGAGLTTSSGRIIMPLYTIKGTVAIFSDDNGETWSRNSQMQYTSNIDEWCAIEEPNGNIYSVGRPKMPGKCPVSVSYDNGLYWEKGKKTAFKAPKCQKSMLAIGDKLLVSHPSGKKRENGVISIAKFDYDKHGIYKGIKWTKDEIEVNNGFFAYSCMAKIDDNKIGILYEDEPSSHIIFDVIEL